MISLSDWSAWTPTEKRLALYGAVSAGGWVLDSSVALGIGLAGLIAAGVELYADRQLTRNPDTMNAFFKTGGALSGLRSDAEAVAFRRGARPPRRLRGVNR